MTAFLQLTSCADLAREHVVAALASSSATRDLCERLAAVARPGEGAERVLFIFASIAAGYADWFDGDLRIELDHAPQGTTIHVLTDLGEGHRERLFPALFFPVPFEEFARAVVVQPTLIGPFHMRATPKGMALSTQDDNRRTTAQIHRVETALGLDHEPPSARPRDDGEIPAGPSHEPPRLSDRTPRTGPLLQSQIQAPPTKKFQVPPELLRKMREDDKK